MAFIITVREASEGDPCVDLSFLQTEAYEDILYKAGDPPVVVQEQQQSLEPLELAAQCPSFE